MKRCVVLSTDLNTKYAFYAPLSALLWRLAGWHPLVMLVGDPNEWNGASLRSLADMSVERARLVVASSYRAGADVFYTGRDPLESQSVGDATAAQLCRLYACWLPAVKEDDYLLTSDVDMWPAGPWIGSAKTDALHLYNGLAYRGQSAPQYPMCYVGATAKRWREIVTGTWRIPDISFNQAFYSGLISFNAARFNTGDGKWHEDERKEREWDFDERHLGRLIQKWTDDGNPVDIIGRDMNAGGQRRLDRSAWHVPRGGWSEFADVHLPRPGFGEQWSSVREVAKAISHDRATSWVDDYHRRWMEAA